MSLTAQVVAELVRAGVSGEDLIAAVERIESAESLRKSAELPVIDEQAERRRAADRERKKSERLRKSAEPSAERDIDNNPSSQDSNNQSIPLRGTSAEEPKPKPYDAPFEDLWQHFSRKVGKDDAHRAWQKIRRRVSHPDLVAAVKAQARLDAGKEKRFIAHPATWLNDGRWQDEELQPPKPQEPTSNGAVYVLYGTDAGDAWERDYRGRGKIPPRDSKGGWYYPTEYPQPVDTHETKDEAA